MQSLICCAACFDANPASEAGSSEVTLALDRAAHRNDGSPRPPDEWSSRAATPREHTSFPAEEGERRPD